MKDKKRYLNCKYLDAGMDGMLCSMTLCTTCKEFNGEECSYYTPKNKMDDKLKPCPFCGGKPYDNYTDRFGYWYITCINCHAQIHARKRKKAIKSWNMRVSENEKKK